jgi:hypothetical protein
MIPAPKKAEIYSLSASYDCLTKAQTHIQYEFIDESASIMSPIHEQSPTPSFGTADSPGSGFTMLLEAAHSAKASHPEIQTLTPPQSPIEPGLKEADMIRKFSRRFLF